MKKLVEGDKMANFNLNEYLKEKHSEIMECKDKNIPFECYEIIASKSLCEQKHIYNILVEVKRYLLANCLN